MKVGLSPLFILTLTYELTFDSIMICLAFKCWRGQKGKFPVLKNPMVSKLEIIIHEFCGVRNLPKCSGI